jgi:hypothetical protein
VSVSREYVQTDRRVAVCVHRRTGVRSVDIAYKFPGSDKRIAGRGGARKARSAPGEQKCQKQSCSHAASLNAAFHRLLGMPTDRLRMSDMLAFPPDKLRVSLPPLLAVAVEIEHRRFLIGLQQAEAARDFLIGFLDPAEVLAEAVLVELLVSLDVP